MVVYPHNFQKLGSPEDISTLEIVVVVEKGKSSFAYSYDYLSFK